MSKIRRRSNDNLDPAAVDQYAAQAAENPSPNSPGAEYSAPPKARPDLPKHRQRAKTGSKGPGTSFRYNASQGQLLDYAVAMEDMKKQELLESLVWPLLEEKYGDQVPFEPLRD